jgi:hypothetical protein
LAGCIDVECGRAVAELGKNLTNAGGEDHPAVLRVWTEQKLAVGCIGVAAAMGLRGLRRQPSDSA